MCAFGALLLVLFFLFLLRRNVKHFVFPLDQEDDVGDLVVVVDSYNSDYDGEAIDVKGLLMIISIQLLSIKFIDVAIEYVFKPFLN